jgi:hypothetical protein
VPLIHAIEANVCTQGSSSQLAAFGVMGGTAASQVLEKEVGKPLKKDQTGGVILE